MSKDELIKLINSTLKLEGFTRKGLSWYKETCDTIVIFSLDRSKWGGELYYAYISCNLKALDKEKYPRFNKTHIRVRLEDLGEETSVSLDLKSNLSLKEREEMIVSSLNNIIGVLRKLETVAEIKELVSEHSAKVFLLTKNAQEFLQ